MRDFFAGLLSIVELGTTAFVALVVVASIIRGARNKFVGSSTYVLDGFSLNPTATGEEAFISISGRHKGLVSWLMTMLGMETRVELKVGAKEWVLRSGSLAGMLTTSVPLGHVQETVCGYQRSLMALFLTIYFALNSLWDVLSALPKLFDFLSAHSELVREQAAHGLAVSLEYLLVSLALALAAGAAFYFSKRIAFAVCSERSSGILFKRSFIGDKLVELAQAEEAAFLLNRLVRAAYYEVPGADIPPFTPTPLAERSALLRWWMLLVGYAALVFCAVLLGIYGAGVNLSIQTTPANAAVWVDNSYFGQSDDNGLLVLKGLTRQPHELHFRAQGYQELVETVDPGKLESTHKLEASLALMRYPVSVYTNPRGASVAIDNQVVGTSNQSGLLLIPSVDGGRHQLSVSLTGYRTALSSVEIQNPSRFQVILVNEAEAAQQEVAARQANLNAYVAQGQALFRSGRYQDAINECDAALKIDPADQAALALKKQIEQTRKILGQ